MAFDPSLTQSQIFSSLGERLLALEVGVNAVFLKGLSLIGQDFRQKGFRTPPTKKLNSTTGFRPTGSSFQGSLLRFGAGSYDLEGWDFSGFTVYLDAGRSATFADCNFGSSDKVALQMLGNANVDCYHCTFDGQTPTAPYLNLVTLQNSGCVGSFRDCAFTKSYSDAIDFQGDLLIDGCRFYELGQGPDPDNHFDLIQCFTGASALILRLVVRNCFFDGRASAFGKTNIIRLVPRGGTIANVLIENNIMLWPDTPSAPMHLSAENFPTGSISNVIVRNNYIDKGSAFYLYPDVPPPTAPAIWANNRGFADLLDIAIPSGSGFTVS